MDDVEATTDEDRAGRGRRLVIVSGDRELRGALTIAVRRRVAESRSVATAAGAVALIRAWRPDVVVLDCELPDGCGCDVMRAIGDVEPTAAVIAVGGRVAPEDSFRMAQLGARVFVAKPVGPAGLLRAFEAALATTPDLGPLARAAVGHLGVREAEEAVRRAMVAEALARAHGSRHAAARLLAISRQLLQHILRKQGEAGHSGSSARTMTSPTTRESATSRPARTRPTRV